MVNTYYNRGKIYTIYIKKYRVDGSERLICKEVHSTSAKSAVRAVTRNWVTGTTRQEISLITDSIGNHLDLNSNF
jgi:hypothetical protein